MEVFNETPYQFSHQEFMYDPGKGFLSAIVKGTFKLVEGGVCTALPKEKQPGVTGPTQYRDVHGNAPKTPMDFTPFKQQGEWLLIGSAHAPGGRAVPALDVTATVGTQSKSLSVYGPRQWVRQADGTAELTDPEPFVEMPIRAEYAHGGEGSQYNLHGIGFEKLGDRPGDAVPAANIMPHGQVGTSWERDGLFAGFGMWARTLLPRRALFGTTDHKWLTRRAPVAPADFNPEYFNAAPTDQRIDGYFRGDEQIRLRNLHPTAADFRTTLPGTVVRCFLNWRQGEEESETAEFIEIATVLDTCIIDVPAGTLTLLWRGTVAIKNEAHDNIDHFFVVEEPVGTPRSAASYASLLYDKYLKVDTSAAEEAEKELQRKLDENNREGLEAIIQTLKKSGGQDELIAEIEKVSTVDEASALIAKAVEKLQAYLATQGIK